MAAALLLGAVVSLGFAGEARRQEKGANNKPADAASGQEIVTLQGHDSDVRSVSWSPDGKRLASGSGDETVKIWNATSGQEVLTLKGHAHSVWSVSWSPDGKRLASGSGDKTVKVWDATSGQEILTLKGIQKRS